MRLGKNARYERQERAKVRAESQKPMTPQERLKALDSKLGVEIGASRERARYAKRLKKEA
jgi:hypothetical protein